MVEEAQTQSSNLLSPVAYIYCDPNESDTLTASSVLASLVKQLLLYLDILRMPWPSLLEERLVREFRHGRKCLLSNELTDALIELLPSFNNTMFFVDGLDTCDPKQSEQLLRCLERLLHTSNTKWKLFVASREEAEMDVSQYLAGCLRISASGKHIASDIHLYVDMEVSSKIVSKGLTSTPSIIQDIKSRLTKESQGM